MFKRLPNLKPILARFLGFAGLFTLFSVFLLVILTKGTTTPIPDPLPPWQNVQLVGQSGPQEQIGIWSDGKTTLLVWPGDSASPNLNIMDIAHDATPTRLQLGVTPRRVSLFPAPDGHWQVLWLDRALTGEDHLMGALITRLRDGYLLERGPTEISDKSTGSYSAGVTTSGDLVVAWNAVAEGQTSLYLERIDGRGRPRQPVLVSDSGGYPTIATDSSGKLHLAWLEPGAKSLWTIRYALVPDNASSTVEGVPLGVIQPGDGHVLESFVLGIDATRVYCLWGTIAVIGESSGQITGFSFPIADSTDTQTFTVTGPGLEQMSLRWPDIPSRPGESLLVAITGTSPDVNGLLKNVPIVVALSPNGVKSVWPVVIPQTGLISRTKLIVDPSGSLKIVWPLLRNDSLSLLYYAVGHTA